MLTTENIKKDFTLISTLFGNTKVYHDTFFFEGQEEFSDLYFKTVGKEIKQAQVDTFNHFHKNHSDYILVIERFIVDNLTNFESSKVDKINQTSLKIEVIEVSFDNPKYDLVLVCGKAYKQFLIFKKDISIRVEFQNGQIKSMQRKNDTTEDNDF